MRGQHPIHLCSTDNAVVESFFATLKREVVDDQVYDSREQARQAIFEDIEVYYQWKLTGKL